VIRFAVGEVLPTEEEVLMRTGVPAGVEPSAAVGALLREACSRISRLARPRGMFKRVSVEDFALVLRGAGRNAAETPLDEIVPRAEALALFVGTIGQEVVDDIAALFRDGDPAVAVMLDAYASEMANAVATDLASRFAGEIRDGARVLPYSPGYCGWHVSGQRALFAALDPH
jgi:GGDEF domain-containing protein